MCLWLEERRRSGREQNSTARVSTAVQEHEVKQKKKELSTHGIHDHLIMHAHTNVHVNMHIIRVCIHRHMHVCMHVHTLTLCILLHTL